jgi:hypothetical protein
MPLLACFHDVDKTSLSLATTAGCVSDDVNMNLTAMQQLLLQFHYKLGHLGFQHLKWFLSKGVFGPLGVCCSSTNADPPKCQACLNCGQQKTPIVNNKHTQVKHGILKAEQLQLGQHVFTDQYGSSTEGCNFTGQCHTQTSLAYKDGTIFCDAASSFISIHHQVGFTATETIRSKLTFEREAT